MLDTTHPPRMQRSRGTAMVAFHHARGATRLADLAMAGSAKVMLPRVPGDVPEVVLLNTSGGLTGGDRLSFQLQIGAGCRVLATTQTAERGYAALGVPAQVLVRASIGAGARLDWLPQETLLYQDAHLERRTEIDLATGAECLLAESLVLGRQAMGETLRSATLQDRRMIRRDGRPVWADSFYLDGGVLADGSAALLNGARALAVVCLVAQGAEDAVGPVRAVLGDGAVSGWDGRCIVRLCAPDGWPLRQQLAQVLRILTGRQLPRVWQGGGFP
ncbi:urease accessory protein UreD [Rhodobacter ferrooxidans]|nr:urease accessory protein UreD [Rhodobacter sp. SW2]